MKKIFISFLVTVIFLQLNAQELVITAPQLKNIILEEYTGINCPYCPYGHQVAEGIMNDYPTRTAIINVHTGYYATPSEGQPDFRTDFGPGLASEASVSGFPSASVNRHLFPELLMAELLWGVTSGLLHLQL